MTAPDTPYRFIRTRTQLIHVNGVVSRIKYRPGYWFRIHVDRTDPDGRIYIQLEHDRPDADTGEYGTGKGGKAYLSPHMTDSEIVRRCLGLALAYEEHEVREFFRYRPEIGDDYRPVFGPHLSVDALWDVANRLDVRS